MKRIQITKARSRQTRRAEEPQALPSVDSTSAHTASEAAAELITHIDALLARW